ncbi:MAG: terpene cyclase/mutase family protein, partial [Gemmataceae bacterium]|nr:terpene cyclase/mutase family protein [Gemmataceae bacterium]
AMPARHPRSHPLPSVVAVGGAISLLAAYLGFWDVSSSESRTEGGGNYRIPMTALAGIALLCEGSTTNQGKYKKTISQAVEYLLSQAKDNGLIGIPSDYRYTYGHGYSMLFLSQVLGEEEDMDRRKRLVEVLTKAVKFCGDAQTKKGGWGYVSARDGSDFDEGSTTVTQVQGLRGCRNAGIKTPKDIIDKAIAYIYSCQMPDGGVCYSFNSRGSSRPAISAAAIATMFGAGEYEGERVKKLISYCKTHLYSLGGAHIYGHWHYTYYYYTQALYRLGGKDWEDYRDRLYKRLTSEQAGNGSWSGYVGQIFCTSLNLTMLQLENAYLPIYQR